MNPHSPECDGYTSACACEGLVRYYRVQGWGFDMKVHYCEAHAAHDRRNGYTVTEARDEQARHQT